MLVQVRALAWLAILASPASAFWRLPCKSPIVVERTDPIVQPGAVSNHVHTIMGGNGFAPTMDYNSTQSSTCSSCTVIGDNSNYWVPALYYQAQDGSFESVDQVGGATVYYLQRAGQGETLKAFPAGFRMVAGNPLKRTGGSDFPSQAISYNCLGTSNPETGNFPNYNCPSGLRAQVFFPSCWNGKDLDTPDHKSHVSYPVGAFNGGSCPPDFPVHLISLFYEIIWDTPKFSNRWYGGKQPFVFAQGDPTGYGGHGDFLMGWEVDHLQRAVDKCTNLSGRVEDCPEFKLIPDNQAQGCSVPSVVNEPVTGKLSKLPGCQTVDPGPAQAKAQSNCGAVNTLSQSTTPAFTDLTAGGWSYAGCGTDNYYNRILTGASTSQASMTNEQCVKFCDSKGFRVAGTEYSKECYCGNSIPDAGAPIPGVPGNCKMPCAGNTAEMCGGAGTITLYTKCSGSTCTNAVKSPGSGSSAPPASSSIPAVSPAPSKSTSQPTASPVVGSSPAASTSGSPSSGPRPSTTSASGPGSGPVNGSPASSVKPAVSTSTTKPAYVPSPSSKPVDRPSTTTTTSTSVLPTVYPTAIFAAPNNATPPTGWTYSGCWTDTVFPRSLSTWSNFNGPKMSNSACIAFCQSQGYTIAGTEYAGQCFCGKGLVTSQLVKDQTQCNMPCTGGAKGEVCGGKGVLSVYSRPQSSAWEAAKVRRHLSAHRKRDVV